MYHLIAEEGYATARGALVLFAAWTSAGFVLGALLAGIGYELQRQKRALREHPDTPPPDPSLAPAELCHLATNRDAFHARFVSQWKPTPEQEADTARASQQSPMQQGAPVTLAGAVDRSRAAWGMSAPRCPRPQDTTP